MKLNLIATTAFGLEAIAKRELIDLGFDDIRAQDGRIDFSGGESAIAKANLWLRCAERVLLNMGEFEATSFDMLFEGTKALPWDEWIPKEGKFTVTGKSVKSKLFSVPDCQSIVKKAIVEKLKQRHHIDWFEESGPEYKVQVALLKDSATLTIDTTGPGLHKRGYRQSAVVAPLKETLAAALIKLSFWDNDRTLLDGVCGCGTIPIEAALIARNIAPGLERDFVSQTWPNLPESIWKQERKAAYGAISHDVLPMLFASDIDPAAVQLAAANAANAGVDDCINFSVTPINKLALPSQSGVAILNPPYGDRLATASGAARLYREMGALFRPNEHWSVYVLTSDEDFERHYGAKANRKRRLFNGMIKTDYYQYHGKRL